MEKKRIGKTLKIRWAILTGGEPESLAGRDLTLEISSGNRVRTTLSFVADGNVAEFVFEGSEQRYVGPYTVTMWENLGKEGQTVVDRCDAFCLVARSCEEAESGSAEDQDLEIESLDLGTSNFEAGVPGASAYELFKKHNPDSELTEEEYAKAPVQAAGAALAMVEQLEETEAAMKQAEQLRKQAEQGREASEQNRATAEQARVTAEQQRALAEQTRVTNESARQTAEAGRQAAETKREENTAGAIRNSEEATRKAEDEAARVRTLADNPPKIVEVDGAKYWAFWDEETEQYVVSENRADVGDAVLFSPQTLTYEQQKQARSNIGVSYPVRQIIDLYPLVGYNCYAVYRFDDSGYYVLCQGHVVKLSLTLHKIYDLNLSNYFNRGESGRDRNLCCKIGNNVFFAACNVSKLVYMYNEDTGEGKYLENPSGLQYYGSVYAIDEKVYYFHRYQSSNVYVYSKDGELLQTIENEQGFIKYTEGTAFTNDGYKVNLSDFSFEPLSFPIEQDGYYYYIFKNGNIIKGMIAISGDNNQKGYLFSSYPSCECDVAFNTNKYTIVYSPQGKLVFTYPYGITNSVNRQQFIDFVIGDGSALPVRKTSLYEKQVYMVDMYNHLIIEDVSLYVTD